MNHLLACLDAPESTGIAYYCRSLLRNKGDQSNPANDFEDRSKEIDQVENY